MLQDKIIIREKPLLELMTPQAPFNILSGGFAFLMLPGTELHNSRKVNPFKMKNKIVLG